MIADKFSYWCRPLCTEKKDRLWKVKVKSKDNAKHLHPVRHHVLCQKRVQNKKVKWIKIRVKMHQMRVKWIRKRVKWIKLGMERIQNMDKWIKMKVKWINITVKWIKIRVELTRSELTRLSRFNLLFRISRLKNRPNQMLCQKWCN